MNRKMLFAAMILMGLLYLVACTATSEEAKLLDPDNPITVSVWNYYNGSTKNEFDTLISEFNETIGTEKGIVIEAQSYGSVNDLADAVFASANKEIGSMPMPDVFAAYPDNAFRINQISELVSLNDYFSEDELNQIKPEFLSEGQFGSNQSLKILPIAKSTEILYLNKTYWDAFAAETGASLDSLATWEGLVKTAKRYYNHTGKSFFSLDANANYMLVSAMELGGNLYTFDDDTATLNFSKDTAYRIWNNFYVPYINGYFVKSGRFSSDDAKTGNIAAYTGSTAGAAYFPTEIAIADQLVPVELLTLPYPTFENTKPYVIQQGAGMCISQSDDAHEYAAAVFLKWFIDLPQNTEFSVSTAYLPVKTAALNKENIFAKMDQKSISNPAVKKSITTTMDMLETYNLYGNRPFNGSYEVRNILETSLFDRVSNDLLILNQRVANGENAKDVIAELSSQDQFLTWYNGLTGKIKTALEKN